MPVRTNRLFGPLTVPSVAASLYTVPSARTARILSLRLVNTSGTPGFIVLGVEGVGISQLVLETTIPATDTKLDLGLVVLEPNEQLWGQAFAGVVTISGHGALLEGPPT